MSYMVQVGDQVPDLELETTAGKVKLSDFRGKKLVLYFFPKAFTMGCTRELKRFTELYDQFKALGAEVIGVSVDSVDTLKRFAEKYGAKFPLASDKAKEVSKTFGVLKLMTASRVTFVIGPDGVVRQVISNLKRAEEHADRALEAVKSI
ncbi:Peroxiredoxin [Acidilobus saccharovorans 345-15]|uniref:thioredoxin-dependent peroxiredoxin n=2 Tax=Acidilobus TaxID=105850 RepID=D9Q100_ACIS3|nr:Peroxiredoxin [Acidilobus saccharovorans 345-15]